MLESTPSCASGTLVAPLKRWASFSKTRVKLSAVGAGNCPTCGRSPFSSRLIAMNEPMYALKRSSGVDFLAGLVDSSAGSHSVAGSVTSTSGSLPSVAPGSSSGGAEKMPSSHPRMYLCGNVKNSAPISMRSTSRMALSTMPSSSGVSMEWPSGRSGSGSLQNTSMRGRPIGFGSTSQDQRAGVASASERVSVSTASGKWQT